MFIGRYYHKLEAKGRVSLPKAFRELEDNWTVTRGLDGGLFLFREKDFSAQISQLAERTFTKKDHRDFIRLMSNDAYQMKVDKNGRVLLPEYLTTFAGLKKDLVIVGSYSYIEIWDSANYHNYLEKIEQNMENISEGLEV